jgi:thioredoxin reductase (NADPH)
LYKNKTVAVIGGGNTAVSDSIFLSNFCKKVYIVHRRDKFRADDSTVQKMLGITNIEPIYNATPSQFIGEKKISSVLLSTGNELSIDGVFVAVGTVPSTDFLRGLDIRTDELGAIITDSYMRTNIEGIYAAGDARSTPLRQIITACADGAIAATSACSLLKGM